jgi:hypothetical protein
MGEPAATIFPSAFKAIPIPKRISGNSPISSSPNGNHDNSDLSDMLLWEGAVDGCWLGWDDGEYCRV